MYVNLDFKSELNPNVFFFTISAKQLGGFDPIDAYPDCHIPVSF